MQVEEDTTTTAATTTTTLPTTSVDDGSLQRAAVDVAVDAGEDEAIATAAATATYLDYPLHHIVQPHKANDVLYGRKNVESSGKNVWLGNKRLQLLVQNHIAEYAKASALDKPMIAMDILNQWRTQNQPPGRFLKLDPESELWNDIGDKKAREKISRMLRTTTSMTTTTAASAAAATATAAATAQSRSTSSESKEDCLLNRVEAPSEINVRSLTTHMDSLATREQDNNDLSREKKVSQTPGLFSTNFKLYDRETHLQELLCAYRRQIMDSGANNNSNNNNAPTEVCLIIGDEGTGKTALAQLFGNHVREMDSAVFLQGRFESSSSSSLSVDNLESTAIMHSILCSFGNQLSSLDQNTVNQFQAALPKVLDSKEVMILKSLSIPGLDSILQPSSQKDINERGVQDVGKGTQASRRLVDMFRRLLGAMASSSCPIIVVFDDLHFASHDSVDWIASLISDVGSRNVFFLITCCHIESNGNQIKRLVDQIGNVRTSHISLGNMTKSAVQSMLADLFKIGDEDSFEELVRFVYDRTKGNILYVKELLQFLEDNELLRYDRKDMFWKVDNHLMNIVVEGTTLEDLMRLKIDSLPTYERDTLISAVYMGSRVDEKLLSRVLSVDSPKHVLALAEKGMLLLNKAEGTFYVRNEVLRKVAYDFVPVSEREHFHLQIGRTLWKVLDGDELEASLCTVLDHLLVGEKSISKEKDCVSVASICLQGGEKAARESSFQKAAVYLLKGISLLGRDGWRAYYELNLRLHNMAIEVSYCLGHFEEIEILVKTVLANARSFTDSLHARTSYIYALGSRARSIDAIDSGLEVLRHLNIYLPPFPSSFQLLMALRKTKYLLRKRSYTALLSLPRLEDSETAYAMQILNLISLHALYARPELFTLIVCRMIKITLECGMCATSCVGFAYYGMILCSEGKNIEEGFKYGTIAVEMVSYHKASAWLGRVSAAFYGCISPWKISYKDILDPLKHAYRSSLASGDIEYAMLNWSLYCWNSNESHTLPTLDRELRSLTSQMRFFGQTGALSMILPLWQFTLNMMGEAHGDPVDLTGEAMNQEEHLTNARQQNESLIAWINFYRAIIAFRLGKYDRAILLSRGITSTLSLFGAMDIAAVLFYEIIISVTQARRLGSSTAKARSRLKQMKRWALHAPDNMLGKQYFLEAEFARVHGSKKKLLAVQKYKSAILHSRAEGLLQQEAMANEHLGKFYVEVGEIENASLFLDEACRLYEEWGGTLKLRNLKDEMVHLLSN